ncbi:TTC28 [Branchiostoma lanceolatum]|uniref:TTC28 protein n=1 Tax=Branchiostoma lanceolatum TaxID=7740 RepID=A0A8K0A1Y2_BRALA|nr:TTC28 [Branchiostoma lanceolatum]
MLRVCEKLREADAKGRRYGLACAETGYLRALVDAMADRDRLLEVELLKSLGDVNLEKGRLGKDVGKLNMALALYMAAVVRCRNRDQGEGIEHRYKYTERLSQGVTSKGSQGKEQTTEDKETTTPAKVAEMFQVLDKRRAAGGNSVLVGYAQLMVEGIVNGNNMLETEAIRSLGDVYLKRGTETRDTRNLTRATALYNTALARCHNVHGTVVIVHRLLHTAKIRQDINTTRTRDGRTTSQLHLQVMPLMIYKEHLQDGLKALQTGDLDKAEQSFAAGLKSVHVKGQHMKEAEPLYKLGDVYLKRGIQSKDGGDFTKAAALYNAAMMVQSIYGEDTAHPDIASSLNNLGNAWGNLGDHRKAISYYEQAIQMKRSIYGEGTAHPDIASSLNNLGYAWWKLGDHRKAVSYYEQSLRMRQSIYGEGTAHPDIASSLNHLGGAWSDLGDHRKVISYYEQSLQMRRSIYGEDTVHPDIAITLNNLGKAWSDLGDHIKAVSYYEQSLIMKRSIYGGDTAHPDIAHSLGNLGITMGNLGNRQKAVRYHEQALQMMRRIYGENTPHPDIASLLNNLGNAWNNIGDVRKAVRYYEQSLQIEQSIYGVGTAHPDVASSLNNLGSAWRILGDLKKAVSYHEQSLQMMRSIYGEDTAHPDIACSLGNLGNAWGDIGDHRKAVSYYEQALQIKRSIYGEDNEHPDIARLLNDLGGAWGNLGDHRKSVRYAEQSLQMRRSIYEYNTGYSVSPEVPARPRVGSPDGRRAIRPAGGLGPRWAGTLLRLSLASLSWPGPVGGDIAAAITGFSYGLVQWAGTFLRLSLASLTAWSSGRGHCCGYHWLLSWPGPVGGGIAAAYNHWLPSHGLVQWAGTLLRLSLASLTAWSSGRGHCCGYHWLLLRPGPVGGDISAAITGFSHGLVQWAGTLLRLSLASLMAWSSGRGHAAAITGFSHGLDQWAGACCGYHWLPSHGLDQWAGALLRLSLASLTAWSSGRGHCCGYHWLLSRPGPVGGDIAAAITGFSHGLDQRAGACCGYHWLLSRPGPVGGGIAAAITGFSHGLVKWAGACCGYHWLPSHGLVQWAGACCGYHWFLSWPGPVGGGMLWLSLASLSWPGPVGGGIAAAITGFSHGLDQWAGALLRLSLASLTAWSSGRGHAVAITGFPLMAWTSGRGHCSGYHWLLSRPGPVGGDIAAAITGFSNGLVQWAGTLLQLSLVSLTAWSSGRGHCCSYHWLLSWPGPGGGGIAAAINWLLSWPGPVGSGIAAAITGFSHGLVQWAGTLLRLSLASLMAWSSGRGHCCSYHWLPSHGLVQWAGTLMRLSLVSLTAWSSGRGHCCGYHWLLSRPGPVGGDIAAAITGFPLTAWSSGRGHCCGYHWFLSRPGPVGGDIAAAITGFPLTAWSSGRGHCCGYHWLLSRPGPVGGDIAAAITGFSHGLVQWSGALLRLSLVSLTAWSSGRGHCCGYHWLLSRPGPVGGDIAAAITGFSHCLVQWAGALLQLSLASLTAWSSGRGHCCSYHWLLSRPGPVGGDIAAAITGFPLTAMSSGRGHCCGYHWLPSHGLVQWTGALLQLSLTSLSRPGPVDGDIAAAITGFSHGLVQWAGTLLQLSLVSLTAWSSGQGHCCGYHWLLSRPGPVGGDIAAAITGFSHGLVQWAGALLRLSLASLTAWSSGQGHCCGYHWLLSRPGPVGRGIAAAITGFSHGLVQWAVALLQLSLASLSRPGPMGGDIAAAITGFSHGLVQGAGALLQLSLASLTAWSSGRGHCCGYHWLLSRPGPVDGDIAAAINWLLSWPGPVGSGIAAAITGFPLTAWSSGRGHCCSYHWFLSRPGPVGRGIAAAITGFPLTAWSSGRGHSCGYHWLLSRPVGGGIAAAITGFSHGLVQWTGTLLRLSLASLSRPGPVGGDIAAAITGFSHGLVQWAGTLLRLSLVSLTAWSSGRGHSCGYHWLLSRPGPVGGDIAAAITGFSHGLVQWAGALLRLSLASLTAWSSGRGHCCGYHWLLSRPGPVGGDIAAAITGFPLTAWSSGQGHCCSYHWLPSHGLVQWTGALLQLSLTSLSRPGPVGGDIAAAITGFSNGLVQWAGALLRLSLASLMACGRGHCCSYHWFLSRPGLVGGGIAAAITGFPLTAWSNGRGHCCGYQLASLMAWSSGQWHCCSYHWLPSHGLVQWAGTLLRLSLASLMAWSSGRGHCCSYHWLPSHGLVQWAGTLMRLSLVSLTAWSSGRGHCCGYHWLLSRPGPVGGDIAAAITGFSHGLVQWSGALLRLSLVSLTAWSSGRGHCCGYHWLLSRPGPVGGDIAAAITGFSHCLVQWAGALLQLSLASLTAWSSGQGHCCSYHWLLSRPGPVGGDIAAAITGFPLTAMSSGRGHCCGYHWLPSHGLVQWTGALLQLSLTSLSRPGPVDGDIAAAITGFSHGLVQWAGTLLQLSLVSLTAWSSGQGHCCGYHWLLSRPGPVGGDIAAAITGFSHGLVQWAGALLRLSLASLTAWSSGQGHCCGYHWLLSRPGPVGRGIAAAITGFSHGLVQWTVALLQLSLASLSRPGPMGGDIAAAITGFSHGLVQGAGALLQLSLASLTAWSSGRGHCCGYHWLLSWPGPGGGGIAAAINWLLSWPGPVGGDIAAAITGFPLTALSSGRGHSCGYHWLLSRPGPVGGDIAAAITGFSHCLVQWAGTLLRLSLVSLTAWSSGRGHCCGYHWLLSRPGPVGGDIAAAITGFSHGLVQWAGT